MQLTTRSHPSREKQNKEDTSRKRKRGTKGNKHEPLMVKKGKYIACMKQQRGNKNNNHDIKKEPQNTYGSTRTTKGVCQISLLAYSVAGCPFIVLVPVLEEPAFTKTCPEFPEFLVGGSRWNLFLCTSEKGNISITVCIRSHPSHPLYLPK